MNRSTVDAPLPVSGALPAAVPRPYLLGLIGAGIQRSLTPAMHEAEAASQGLQLHYQLIDLDLARADVSVLPMLLDAAQIMGFAGLNITFPCKQAVIALLDELSQEAAAVGAVNTVVFDNGRACGHNTDSSGWRWGFERTLPRADLSCVALLGAGGAGSAVAHALLSMGAASLRVMDAVPAVAEALVARLSRQFPGRRVVTATDLSAAMRDVTGLVHATPTGMDKLPGMPLPARLLHPKMWVSEVVYFPLETALLRAARECGCAIIDGGTMAVGQAIGAFKLFTGRDADPNRVDAVFRALVRETRLTDTR